MDRLSRSILRIRTGVRAVDMGDRGLLRGSGFVVIGRRRVGASKGAKGARQPRPYGTIRGLGEACSSKRLIVRTLVRPLAKAKCTLGEGGGQLS